MKRITTFAIGMVASAALLLPASANALDNPGIASDRPAPGYLTLIDGGRPPVIVADSTAPKGLLRAVSDLSADFGRVCGTDAATAYSPSGPVDVICGTVDSPIVKQLAKKKLIDLSDLKGCNEKYMMQTVDNPWPGVDRALVIAGSDMRGAIYGVYELSEQIGVSPWYDWADVPAQKHSNLAIREGRYTAGEPAVRYRGIFLNDEGPCLMDWVKNTYGTSYGDHRFYERVGELILRLRGNFLWPAMWAWAFYADDPLNSPTLSDMGVMVGTSHHEPMARNHQEYARNRAKYGPWNYNTNPHGLDRFFAEGIERMRGTGDVVTIGMRGDGDEAMGADADVALLKKVIDSQRRIIAKNTGRPAKETPQVWALYKEVLDYYDKGLKAPDDAILLLCDDNWGNIRRLPDAEGRKHPGGWGMYYHVDYVGGPRNSKLLNCTPTQNMWEQMTLCRQYGVDKLWILNVGDLKPMEYPITLFLDMAWNPDRYNAGNLTDHTRAFCAAQFGDARADEAARILNLVCKYNGRCTPEMLDRNTYALDEWETVCNQYARLEAEALRQYVSLPEDSRDAYFQLILFPLQLMGNLHDMYRAQAMNHDLHAKGMPEADMWADRVAQCFKRDGELMRRYNKEIAGGKWDGIMTQKHIGYTEWNDSFPADTMPEVRRVADTSAGGVVFEPVTQAVVIEAMHFNEAADAPQGTQWTLYPHMGRTDGAVAVTPYDRSPEGARLVYTFTLPEPADSVTVHVVTKSTLPFSRLDGHRYKVSLQGSGEAQSATVNFNGNLNEKPENIWSVYYPTVARRVVDKMVTMALPAPAADGTRSLVIEPLDPGIVFEKIVIDAGAYRPGYLFGSESPHRRR